MPLAEVVIDLTEDDTPVKPRGQASVGGTGREESNVGTIGRQESNSRSIERQKEGSLLERPGRAGLSSAYLNASREESDRGNLIKDYQQDVGIVDIISSDESMAEQSISGDGGRTGTKDAVEMANGTVSRTGTKDTTAGRLPKPISATINTNSSILQIDTTASGSARQLQRVGLDSDSDIEILGLERNVLKDNTNPFVRESSFDIDIMTCRSPVMQNVNKVPSPRYKHAVDHNTDISNPDNVQVIPQSSMNELLPPARKSSPPISYSVPSGVIILSDDFPSSVNFDDSWLPAEQRSPKRRKLSPSPFHSDELDMGLLVGPRGRTSIGDATNQTHKDDSHVDDMSAQERPIRNDNDNDELNIIATATSSTRPSTTTNKHSEFSDPIIFTSSPADVLAGLSTNRRHLAMEIIDEADNDNNDDDDDDIPPLSTITNTVLPPRTNRVARFSRTISAPSAFADFVTSNYTRNPPTWRKENSFPYTETHSRIDEKIPSDGYDDDDVVPERPNPAKRKPPSTSSSSTTTTAAAAERAKAREAERNRKALEKEAEKERKQRLKEDKAREKQRALDLAQVNRAKTDKKLSTPEMILDLPSSLSGSSIDTQLREYMKNLQVETTTYDSASAVPNVIKWRRKVIARFNEEMDLWEPIPKEIHSEKHVLCIVSATEFVELATSGSRSDSDSGPTNADLSGHVGNNLESHVRKLKAAYPDVKPIYLIEGLTAWMRKNKNLRNRAYQAAVLRQMNNDDAESRPAQSSRRKQKEPPVIIDEDMIEDALLRLQLLHACLIHHTAVAGETAEWIVNFTQHISTIPYRNQRANLNTSFCMDVGQVKTGEDKFDTFTKMLQEIVRVTPPIAYGIAAQYPDVRSLMRAFRRDGPLVLQDLQKSANRSGAFTSARIGPAISRRLYAVFMGTDPDSNDV